MYYTGKYNRNQLSIYVSFDAHAQKDRNIVQTIWARCVTKVNNSQEQALFIFDIHNNKLAIPFSS